MKVYNEVPEKMKAMVLTSPGKWEIQKVKVPYPEEGEVLCRIESVAICGSDPAIVHGETVGVWPPSYPFIAGHEWSGTVIAIGKGVTDVEIGERVAGEAHMGCGYCENCMKGLYNLCLNYGKPETGHRHYGFTIQGAYAQYNVYNRKSIVKVPSNISFDEAAMCDTAGVALHGLELSGINAGDSVVVIGPGPIGMMAMKIAKAMGAGQVIVVGRKPRIQTAADLGADHVVDFSNSNPVDEVRHLTGGMGVNVVLECSGASGTLVDALGMCKKGGKVVMLGVAKEGVTEEIPLRFTAHNELTIVGSRANPNTSRKVLSLISGGNIDVKNMVTHIFSLDTADEAFETFEKRIDGAMKVVIHPNDD